MAVYTEVSDEALQELVAEYDIGEAVSCKGIAEGVENSNYLLQTTRGTYILTLYEKRVKRDDLPFFLALMDHLAGQGLSCPTPVHGRDGSALREVCGRPAAIVSFLKGMWPRRITPRHCQQLGDAMARLHLAGAGFTMRRPNALSVGAWRGLAQACGPRADGIAPGLADEITAELDRLEAAWPAGLPGGVIHGDLFPDNVFFLDDRLSGIIDFYFACTDFLAYDIAVCLNAWCFEPDRSFNATKGRLLLASYQEVRRCAGEEIAALPLLARGSALRFLLTRLYDWLNHPAGALVKPKDPLEYLAKMRFWRTADTIAGFGL